MAIRTPPSWLQGGSHSAENDRLTTLAEYLSAGVFGTTDLSVAQNGTPNMSVNVAPGYALVAGTLTSTQGNYAVYNDATVNLAITAANATLPRIDLVVATVNDAQYSGATNNVVLQVITGTAAGSPVAPTVPANSLLLAQIAVGAAVTSIVNANITDKRPRVINKPAVLQSDAAGADSLQIVDNVLNVLIRARADGLFGDDAGGNYFNAPAGNAFTTSAIGKAIGQIVRRARRFSSGQTADIDQWQDETSAAMLAVDKNGHLCGRGTAPTVAAGAALGTTPPAPVVNRGNDQAGRVTFGTGTATAAGVICTITYNRAYATSPMVVIQQDSGPNALDLFCSNATAGAITVSCRNAPTASQVANTYGLIYQVIGA